jgi:hypothetical protein
MYTVAQFQKVRSGRYDQLIKKIDEAIAVCATEEKTDTIKICLGDATNAMVAILVTAYQRAGWKAQHDHGVDRDGAWNYLILTA